MSSDEKKIINFINDFLLFQGKMSEFKDNTERRLFETNMKLSSIERDVTTIMLDHKSVTEMYNTLKNDMTEQDIVNINQEDKNISMNTWQKGQDNNIRDLQEKGRTIELRINNHDLAKVALLVTAIATPILAIIQIIIGRWG